jgi:hypothetical protein
MENKIGTVVYTDTVSFERAVSHWQAHVIPAIKKVSEIYCSLGIGKFTQAIFNDILENGTINIASKYKVAVEADVTRIGAKTLAATIDTDGKIAQNIKVLREAMDGINRVRFTSYADIFFEDCSIEKEKAVLNFQRLEKRYQVTIDSEIKSQAVQQLNKIADLCEEFRTFLQNNIRPGISGLNILGDAVSNNQCFIYEDTDGSIRIEPRSLELLK